MMRAMQMQPSGQPIMMGTTTIHVCPHDQIEPPITTDTKHIVRPTKTPHNPIPHAIAPWLSDVWRIALRASPVTPITWRAVTLD